MDLETFYNVPGTKRFAYPGTLVWGEGCRARLSPLIEGAPTVALWVDAAFAGSSFVTGLRAGLCGRLVADRVVRGMPLTGEVDEAIAAGAGRVAAVVAIGGGSTIDAAKAVIAGALYGTYDGVGMGERRGLPVLPDTARPLFVALPTTAGTGAEASRYYVTYDSVTRAKVHGKSWRLLADWVLLDPWFLADSPRDLLVGCAFDAFVHLWESFICREERSWFNEMLSVEGIGRVMHGLGEVLDGAAGDEALLELQYAASLGGIAISNVRTGEIHEAAGALLEHSELTHPETLSVFFAPAVERYRDAVGDRLAVLLPHLAARLPGTAVGSLDDLLAWWDRAFDAVGLRERVAEALGRVELPAGELEEHIVARVKADRVWAEKEGPVPLGDADIAVFVADSLWRSGYGQARR